MADDRCNCPPITPRTMREGIGTKPPCPVHDTPERLAALAEIIVPAKPMGEFKIGPFRHG